MQYDLLGWVIGRLDQVERDGHTTRRTAEEANRTATDTHRTVTAISAKIQRIERIGVVTWYAARISALLVILITSVSPERTGSVLKALLEMLVGLSK